MYQDTDLHGKTRSGGRCWREWLAGGPCSCPRRAELGANLSGGSRPYAVFQWELITLTGTLQGSPQAEAGEDLGGIPRGQQACVHVPPHLPASSIITLTPLLPHLFCTQQSQQFFKKTSIESLTHTRVKHLRGPRSLISVPPTSFPCSSHSSHTGLFTCSHPRTLAYAVLSWRTAGRPFGHPIPNTLTRHLTLHLLAACLGLDGHCSVQLGA